MNDKRFSIQAEILTLAEGEYRMQVQCALNHLDFMLQSYGYGLRDDSRLAYLWATGQLPNSWSDFEVCHEILCQQWLCHNTQYTALSQPFMRALANNLREKYNISSWNTVWRIVREYGPDILKCISITDAGGQFPTLMSNSGHVAPIDPTGGDDRSPASRTYTEASMQAVPANVSCSTQTADDP